MDKNQETKTPVIKDTMEYVLVNSSGLVVRSFGSNLELAQNHMKELPSSTTVKLFLRSTTHIEVPRG